MEISKILVSKTRKKGFILDTVQRGKKWSNCHEVGRVRQKKRGYCEGSWKLCAAIFIASLFFAACLTSDSRAKETERGSWKERERVRGTVCIVGALFGRFRVNVNYQNCFGTWLTDSKPKAIKIFMTHWVITSNPQTWVMPRPLPLHLPYCLPPTHLPLLQSALKGREKFSWTERENLRPKAKRKCEKTPHNGRY